MREQFHFYIIDLYQDIPVYIYIILLALFSICVVFFLSVFKIKKSLLYLSRFLFLEYLFLIYSSTVFFRDNVSFLGYSFSPLWSYNAIKNGRLELLSENIMNVVIFIPIGFLLGCGFSKWSWWKVFVLGFLFSMTIEVMQFAFKRGFCEIDDVIHNTLGCMIGYGLYILTTSLVRRHGFE